MRNYIGGIFSDISSVKGEDKIMRRRTTTKKLQQAITNNLLHITKAEVYYKTSRVWIFSVNLMYSLILWIGTMKEIYLQKMNTYLIQVQ